MAVGSIRRAIRDNQAHPFKTVLLRDGAEHLYQFGNIDFLCFPYQDGVIPHRLQRSFDFPLKGQYALIGDFTQGHGDFRLENTVDG